MTIQNRRKLNHLLQNWPRGTVYTQSELTKNHISRQLVVTYLNSSWLKRIGPGAFIRADDQVDWLGGVYAIQHQLNLPIYVAGKTALQLQGYAHFVPLGSNYPVWLFGEPDNKLPTWFKKYSWNVILHYKTTKLFTNNKLGLKEHDRDTFSILISSPERAILETLYLVPNEQSLEESQLLMEGLTSLRPMLVQELLESCNSIKTKRLFLFLVEHFNHPWFKKINVKNIDLGHGKRMIVSDGKFDPKYQITISKE